MFKLNEPLEASIEFEGVNYPLNLAFDTVLDVYEILEDKTLSNFQKVDYSLDLLLNGQEVELELKPRLFEAILKQHIQQAKEKAVYDLAGNIMPQKPKEEQEQLFSFVHDAEYIFASFWQAYHMDLHEEIGRLSWKKFQILFSNLPEETKFKRVLEIRQWKPVKGTSSEERQRMMELQDIYALPDREEDEDE